MSETGFRMFNQAFSVVAELLYAGLLTAFFQPFLSRGRRAGKLLLLFSTYLLLALACDRTALPQGAFSLLLTGMGLVQSGAYACLEDYLARMDESVSGFALELQTGNPVTDVIVGGVRRQSAALGIRLQVDFHYPDPAAYDAFDVGTILQNLLQNAVEACGKVQGERYITLTGTRRGRFFLIEVRNSSPGEVVFGPDGLPVTTKQEDAPMHGIGLANVRREAEKYMGELELRADQQEFSVTVLLQERSSL